MPKRGRYKSRLASLFNFELQEFFISKMTANLERFYRLVRDDISRNCHVNVGDSSGHSL